MIADGEYVPDLKNISDGQLFALIAAKDDLAHAAYRVLYDRYAQLIWSLCCDAGSKLVRRNKEQFVEELFSQTMIKIYVHPTYDPIRGKVSTWISGIARNTAFDLLKECNDHTQTTDEPIPEFSSEEDESTTSSPLHLLLTQALEMLSDREKDILLTYLMYEDGTKYLPGTVLQELCTRHGITADNARQIKSRAMKKLRQQIQLLEMDK